MIRKINKRVNIIKFITLFFYIISWSIVSSADVNQGKLIFEKNCVSCHTIGEGKKVGPDLKEVPNRLRING